MQTVPVPVLSGGSQYVSYVHQQHQQDQQQQVVVPGHGHGGGALPHFRDDVWARPPAPASAYTTAPDSHEHRHGSDAGKMVDDEEEEEEKSEESRMGGVWVCARQFQGGKEARLVEFKGELPLVSNESFKPLI